MATITRNTTLFFDASVLVSGSHSPAGGSALLLEACKHGGFRAQITVAVLVETLRALRDNFPQSTIERFYVYLTEIHWELVAVPGREVLDLYAQYLDDPDDVHVLAAAAEAGSEFLLTLDRRHILAARDAIQQAAIPLTILRPGDFIREYYPLHTAYTSLPQPRGAS